MIGVLNVLYENNPAEVHQYYRTLAERFAAEGPAFRVFTIDNSRVSLRHLVPESATYRHFPENIGYTRACNLLMAEAFAAGCDRVLATNLDGFLMPGSVAALVGMLDKHHGRALVEARQFPLENLKVYEPGTGRTEWASGCCLLLSRETVETLGPLDERMFLYAEDVDYSFRATLAGIPSITCAEGLFFHRHNPTLRYEEKLKQQLISCRFAGAKWRIGKLREMVEQRLVREGFFRSIAELPAIPDDLETLPCPLDWMPEHRLNFALRRWVP